MPDAGFWRSGEVDSSSVCAQVGRERRDANTDAAARGACPAYIYAVLDEPCGTSDSVPAVHALTMTWRSILAGTRAANLDVLFFMLLRHTSGWRRCIFLVTSSSSSSRYFFSTQGSGWETVLHLVCILIYPDSACQAVSGRCYIPSLAYVLKQAAV